MFCPVAAFTLFSYAFIICISKFECIRGFPGIIFMNWSNYDTNIPGKILLQDKPGWRCNTHPHWHSELEFVYMIKGSLKATINGKEQTIHSGEFYFVIPR